MSPSSPADCPSRAESSRRLRSLSSSTSAAAFRGSSSRTLHPVGIVAPPIGDRLAILRTFDHGATWETVLLSEDAAFDNAQAALAYERWAIVAASHVLNTLNRQPIVFITQDGGDTWSAVELQGTAYSRAFLDLAVAW